MLKCIVCCLVTYADLRGIDLTSFIMASSPPVASKTRPFRIVPILPKVHGKRLFSSVQNSSRWHLCARISPYALHPDRQKFSQLCLWNNSSKICLIDDVPLSFLKEDRRMFPLSTPFSPRPGDRWCDVLGNMHEGSVSSSSILQIFRDASHLRWLLWPQVYLLCRFPSLRHVQGSTPTGIFEGGCRPLTHSSLGLPFHRFLFCNKLIESVRMMACVVWLSPLETIQQRVWVRTWPPLSPVLHWFNGCTLYIYVGCTDLMDAPWWQRNPILTGLWWQLLVCTVRSWGLLLSWWLL